MEYFHSLEIFFEPNRYYLIFGGNQETFINLENCFEKFDFFSPTKPVRCFRVFSELPELPGCPPFRIEGSSWDTDGPTVNVPVPNLPLFGSVSQGEKKIFIHPLFF